MCRLLAVACGLLAAIALPGQSATDGSALDLEALLRSEDALRRVAEDPAHRLQLVVAEVVDDDRGPRLRRHQFGDAGQYFYPASSIKLGAAVAALDAWHRLNRARVQAGQPTFSLAARLVVQPRAASDAPPAVHADSRSADSLRDVIRRIGIVSDNRAFNTLFECLGHRAINERLWTAGFSTMRIQHRLSTSHRPSDERITRAVDWHEGDQRHRVPAAESDLTIDNTQWSGLQLGTAHLRGGRRIEEPLDFTRKNACSLVDLQNLLAYVVRPELVPNVGRGLMLSTESRALLRAALRDLPQSAPDLGYATDAYPDEYVKFLLPGLRRAASTDRVVVYAKIGRAYGFSVENSYVEDRATGRGFFVACSIYTNADGTLNDDRYEYAELADPFFAALGFALAKALW